MKTRIAVLGIGGVGGFYGGKLARYFSKREEVEVIFIAQGKQKEAIYAHGLKVAEGENEFTAYPDLVSDEPATLGKFDVLLFCVKAYSLTAAMESVKSNITSETIILPLMNGISPYEILVKEFPDASV